MKKSIVKLASVATALIISISMSYASKEEGKKAARKAAVEKAASNKAMSTNGNYKHSFPTSPNTKFKENFGKPAVETTNRNYKQQFNKTNEQKNVKFKDNFAAPTKRNTSSYKHPQGL